MHKIMVGSGLKRNTALLRYATGIAITLIMMALMIFKFPPFELLETKLLDARFNARGPLKAPDTVVIAAIDEKSLEKLGRWPWDRAVLAKLVSRLTEANAAVIAFDIILSETSPSDPLLARSMNDAGNVILPIVFDFQRHSLPIDDPVLKNSAYRNIANRYLFTQFPPITADGLLIPVPSLRDTAMSLGHINMFPDNDGTLRWEAMAIGYGGDLYPPLSLQAAAAYAGIPPERMAVYAATGIGLGNAVIPTDGWGRSVINYYGPAGTFRTVSVADIVSGAAAPGLFNNKVVLVGATASGIYDLRVTPYSAALPGVEKHAGMIASLLEKRFIRRTPLWGDLACLIVSGLLLTFLLNRVRIVGASLISGVFLAVLALAGHLLFTGSGIWLNLAYPANNLLFIFMGITALNYAVEEKRARKIRAMFSSYVTQTIVNELIKNPDMARLGGERREVTVLFSDVKGFTAFSENHSPEEVVALLNEYLEAMTDVILSWEGTLDKFIGDAIMVFWNAPVRHERHAEQAVGCAMEMNRRLAELRKKWRSEGKPLLEAGIGINTGEAVVGNIGADGKKMDYTVIGDHVNLGSRIESLTRKFDASILITEYTLERLRQAVSAGTLRGVSFQGLARVIVKGKEQSVGIYRVTPLHGPQEPSVIHECPAGEAVKLTEK